MKFGNHVDLGNFFFYLGEDESVIFKRGENKSFFFFFFLSNLGGELVYIFVICCYCISIICFWFHICCYLLFICLYFHTCSDVLFWVFQERHVHFDQDLLPLLVTSSLGVLDWDLWCIWTFYCMRALCCMYVLSQIVKWGDC